MKSPATIQGVPRGIGKSLRSLSERLVSEGAPLYTEEMRTGHAMPSDHLTLSTMVQMSLLGERSCRYWIDNEVHHLCTSRIALGLEVGDEADQVDGAGRKEW